MTENGKIKILTVMMKHDYGVETRGFSYEYINVHLPLADIYGGENVILFDFMSEIKRLGRSGMNQSLKQKVMTEKPDVTVFCLFEDEFDKATVDGLRGHTKTAAYFFDDPWRQKYVREWIGHFDYFSTPDYYMYRQYESEGVKKAVYSPFGFNPKVYKKLQTEKKYDVTFVGGQSPLRKWIIGMLEKEGIRVQAFGRGWGSKDSWVSQEQIVEIINQSRINLNLSNGISYDMKFLASCLTSPRAVKDVLLLKKHREQVKGRHFEINGCGGFQLSYYVPGLNTVYEIEKEIAAFDNVYNLPDMIRFYLKNEGLRESIAIAGYERSQKCHIAQNYLKNFISRILSGN